MNPLLSIPFLENTTLFLFIIILGITFVSLISRYLSVATFSGFLMFVALATKTNNTVLTTSIYAVLVLVSIGMALKLWNTMLGSGGSI